MNWQRKKARKESERGCEKNQNKEKKRIKRGHQLRDIFDFESQGRLVISRWGPAQILPGSYPEAWNSMDNSLFLRQFCGSGETVEGTGQMLNHPAKTCYTLKSCDAIPLHHSNWKLRHTQTQKHFCKHMKAHTWTQLAIVFHIWRACRQPDTEQDQWNYAVECVGVCGQMYVCES